MNVIAPKDKFYSPFIRAQYDVQFVHILLYIFTVCVLHMIWLHENLLEAIVGIGAAHSLNIYGTVSVNIYAFENP